MARGWKCKGRTPRGRIRKGFKLTRSGGIFPAMRRTTAAPSTAVVPVESPLGAAAEVLELGGTPSGPKGPARSKRRGSRPSKRQSTSARLLQGKRDPRTGRWRA